MPPKAGRGRGKKMAIRKRKRTVDTEEKGKESRQKISPSPNKNEGQSPRGSMSPEQLRGSPQRSEGSLQHSPTPSPRSRLPESSDDEGAKRAFIQHGITRLNREEGSAIDLAKFTYNVDYVSDTNPQYMSYVTSDIQTKEDIRYPIPGLNTNLVMERGERLYFHEGAGLSCKYTLEQLRNIVQKAGLRLVDTWTDEKRHAVFCQCV